MRELQGQSGPVPKCEDKRARAAVASLTGPSATSEAGATDAPLPPAAAMRRTRRRRGRRRRSRARSRRAASTQKSAAPEIGPPLGDAAGIQTASRIAVALVCPMAASFVAWSRALRSTSSSQNGGRSRKVQCSRYAAVSSKARITSWSSGSSEGESRSMELRPRSSTAGCTGKRSLLQPWWWILEHLM